MKKIVTLLILIFGIIIYSALPGDVVFNEISWGTGANAGHEWLELYNQTDEDINLTGWVIEREAGMIADLADTTKMNTATIKARGFYLIEWKGTSSPYTESISDIKGDFQGLSYNGLTADGEHLTLKDNIGTTIDEFDCSSGWFVANFSMEKKHPSLPSNLASSWAQNDGITVNGLDANGNPIRGTPRKPNSVGAGNEAYYLKTTVNPKRIEVTGGTPAFTDIEVQILDKDYLIYTSTSITVDLYRTPETGSFDSGTTLNVVNGIGNTVFRDADLVGTLTIGATYPSLFGSINVTLQVMEIDTTGPEIISFIPDNEIPLRSVKNISSYLVISEEGGMTIGDSIEMHYKIVSSTGIIKATDSVSMNYSSGGTKDGSVIYGDLTFFKETDFTRAGLYTLQSMDTIDIWFSAQDHKGNEMSELNNSELDPYITITVKDVKLLITEVEFLGTIGNNFVEILCLDDGNEGNGSNLAGYYIDDLDGLAENGARASITSLDTNADKKIGDLTIKTGEYLVLWYKTTLPDETSASNNMIKVYTSKSGLTATDEQAAVFTPYGELLDIVAWADYNGSLSDDDFKKSFVGDEWNMGYGNPSAADEEDCVPSNFSKGSIVRDFYHTDTNDKGDWSNTRVITPGYHHPPDVLPDDVDIVISEVYFNSPSGYPDWVELYCKDDGNNGMGVDIGGCYVNTDGPIKIIEPGTFIRTGEFIIVAQGNPVNDEKFAGADGILTVFAEKLSITATDENIDFRDFSGNIKDAVLWAEKNTKSYQLPLDENGDLLPSAMVEPADEGYDPKWLVDISYLEVKDFYEILNSTDTKLGKNHWEGRYFKFFPNLAKYPDFPDGPAPNPNYVYDWVYVVEGAIISNNVKEKYSITRDANFTDTNTKDDWIITDKPSMGRAYGGDEHHRKLTDIKIDPKTFVNDGSMPDRLYTTIQMQIWNEGVLTIRVYDIAGREMRTLEEKLPVPPGPYSVKWWGDNNDNGPLPIGVYIVYVELRTAGKSVYKKEIVAIGKRM